MSETLNVTADQAQHIFDTTEAFEPTVEQGDTFTSQFGVELRFGSTTLGLKPIEGDDSMFEVPGNTVPRICGALGSCAATKCGLGDERFSNLERKAKDCAVANTIQVFDGRPGFVLTPTEGENPAKVVFLSDGAESYDDITAYDEDGDNVLLFRKVKQASSFVVSEYDPIVADSEEGIFVAMNGADSSLGVATMEVLGTRYAVTFCSSRPNLGTRGPDFQILRKAVEGILDRERLVGSAREAVIKNLKVQVDIGYSATLKNFAHDVRVPAVDTPYADKLIAKHGLTSASQITPKMVMEDQYPGSLGEGEVYPHLEAEMGIDAPYTDGGCPGDGELCHINYPKITQRTLEYQLMEMGVQSENIYYNNSRAVDPAAVENNLASNRRFQLAGVPAANTLRSAQGNIIAFPMQWREDRIRESEDQHEAEFMRLMS